MVLDKKAILEATDIKTEKVSVPEWGDHVWVRGLTGTERDQYESQNYKMDGSGGVELSLANASARLCVLAIVDKDGKRIFTDNDVAAIGNKSGAALDRVTKVARRLSGLGPDAVEGLAKN